ncbi:MAG: flagellin [Deltaproteobacteria bacterium]|nr:flagellin [Deltaproteobacteria bacterium]
MALRINHNIPALNALRNLNKTDGELSGSLEKLSSGQRINRAADGPATLVISEQMRGQIASIEQAIRNSEASTSMVQTAEATLDEVNKLLVSMRQLAIHAANEGANDDNMLLADQSEIENALDSIDRIARNSQYGTRTLLDGSNGANGVAVGDGLSFVAASPETVSSPAEGYKVNITRAATRTEKQGTRAINWNDINPSDTSELVAAFEVMISEGGRTASFSLDNNEDGEVIRKTIAELKRNPMQYDSDKVIKDIREVIAQTLQRKANDNGMNVDVYIDRGNEDKLTVRHREFGSAKTFFVASGHAGVLASEPGRFEEALRGRDVEGLIDDKIALGDGEILKGSESTDVEGLEVRFNSVGTFKQRLPKFVADGPQIIPNPQVQDLNKMTPPVPGARPVSMKEEGEFMTYTWEIPSRVEDDIEGYVHVTQNSLSFQVGPTRGQTVKLSLLDAKADRLSTGLENMSGFKSLSEIDVTTSQGAQDAILLIDEAINQVSTLRATLGAFQKNTLETNTSSLRIAHENLTSAESSLRDADMAEEVSTFTRNQIMLASGMAMLAQANQTPQSVLTLLTNRGG